jgi:predicted PurR-regulated permease PerM
MMLTRPWARPLFLAISGAAVIATIIVAHDVMLPFVMALVIAYVLTPLVSWVERKRVPRVGAILLVYAFVLGTIYLFVRLTAPRIAHEVTGLSKEAPRMIADAKSEYIPQIQSKLDAWGLSGPPADVMQKEEDPALVVHPQNDGSYEIEVQRGVTIQQQGQDKWVIAPREPKAKHLDVARVVDEAQVKTSSWLGANALELARIGSNFIIGVARGVFVVGITLMLAAYLMLTREKIVKFFLSLVRPTTRPSFEALLERIDRGLAGVVRGQIIICMINGVLSAIGFMIVGLKYWPVLALVAAVLSLIPIFGSIVSSIPAVAIGLTQGLGTAVFVLFWIIGIHQLEANFLNPKIMGDQAKIHPVLVVFSLIVGEHFWGAPGALLAVPCMSIAQSLFLHFRYVIHRADPELAPEATITLPPPEPTPQPEAAHTD